MQSTKHGRDIRGHCQSECGRDNGGICKLQKLWSTANSCKIRLFTEETQTEIKGDTFFVTSKHDWKAPPSKESHKNPQSQQRLNEKGQDSCTEPATETLFDCFWKSTSKKKCLLMSPCQFSPETFKCVLSWSFSFLMNQHILVYFNGRLLFYVLHSHDHQMAALN